MLERRLVERLHELGAAAEPVAATASTYVLPAALAANWLAGAWDQNAGIHAASPAASVAEENAGKYLGISNLAGAGAGIVGTGIGGPMADFFNKLNPGLGYEVIYAIYGVLFLVSILVLSAIRKSK